MNYYYEEIQQNDKEIIVTCRIKIPRSLAERLKGINWLRLQLLEALADSSPGNDRYSLIDDYARLAVSTCSHTWEQIAGMPLVDRCIKCGEERA